MATATATSHERLPGRHLPPSPPPSPPSTRRRHKKKPDPFEQLALTPIPSGPSSPTHQAEDEDSLITRIFFTPVLVISFILSLFLVNYNHRARRTAAHSPSSSFLAYFSPSRWLDPEPYQDPDDSTWARRGSVGHVEPHDAIGPKTDRRSGDGKKKSWHFNKKIRKMARLEVGDALEMRGQVVVGLLAVVVLSSVMLWTGVKWVLVAVFRILFRTSS